MNTRPNAAERNHMARVKALACSVCDAPGPSEAHHIDQRHAYTVIACCPDCHRGPQGWHGDKSLWRVRKLDELGALNTTLRRLVSAE